MFHDQKNHRFIIENDKGDSHLDYRLTDGNNVTVTHTVVPAPLSGQGLAAQLATAFYRWAKETHLTIHSECSYMDAWLKRHHRKE